MAFTGVPVLKKVTETLFRLTGVTLQEGDIGTIGFTDKTVPANVSLSAPNWEPYELSNAIVGLQDSVHCSVVMTDEGDNNIVYITKTGTTHANFEIALQTYGAGESRTEELEIWIEFGGH